MKIGSHHTTESKARMSISQKLSPHGKKGKRRPLSEEHKEKLSNANKGKSPSVEHRAHLSKAMSGRKLTAEHRIKLSESHKGNIHDQATKMKMSLMRKGKRCGEDNPQWKGGISFEPYCPRFNKDLKRRIRAFFDYRCVICGKPQSLESHRLSCHHVEYNKQACCDGEPVHFAALCHRHHGQTNSNRKRWEAMLHRIIDEIYGGRSYFTKEEWRNIT